MKSGEAQIKIQMKIEMQKTMQKKQKRPFTWNFSSIQHVEQFAKSPLKEAKKLRELPRNMTNTPDVNEHTRASSLNIEMVFGVRTTISPPIGCSKHPAKDLSDQPDGCQGGWENESRRQGCDSIAPGSGKVKKKKNVREMFFKSYKEKWEKMEKVKQ